MDWQVATPLYGSVCGAGGRLRERVRESFKNSKVGGAWRSLWKRCSKPWEWFMFTRKERIRFGKKKIVHKWGYGGRWESLYITETEQYLTGVSGWKIYWAGMALVLMMATVIDGGWWGLVMVDGRRWGWGLWWLVRVIGEEGCWWWRWREWWRMRNNGVWWGDGEDFGVSDGERWWCRRRQQVKQERERISCGYAMK